MGKGETTSNTSRYYKLFLVLQVNIQVENKSQNGSIPPFIYSHESKSSPAPSRIHSL